MFESNKFELALMAGLIKLSSDMRISISANRSMTILKSAYLDISHRMKP